MRTAIAAPEPDPIPPYLRAMLDALSPLAIAELERVLRLRLPAPERDPIDARRAAISTLTFLVAEGSELRCRYPTRSEYDEFRQQDEPNAATLVRRYGSWLAACQAAERLANDPDDWRAATPSVLHGRRRAPAHTREDVRAALRACAFDVGRRPSADIYRSWARRERALGRQGGAPRRDGLRRVRIPTFARIYQLYPRGENRWRQAIDDAQITDAELAAARARKFGLEPADDLSHTLRDNSPNELDPLALPLSQAVEEAQARGCSLEHLAGKTISKGFPPPAGTRFNGAAATAQRRQRKIPETRLREVLGLQLGPYRRLLSDVDELTLGQLLRLAEALRVAPTQILTEASSGASGPAAEKE